jgi:CRP-like cAMP-binding protein
LQDIAHFCSIETNRRAGGLKMDFATGLRRLSGEGWLAQTDPAFRHPLLAMARWHSAPAGTQLTVAGDEAGDLIGVAEGTIAVTIGLGVASAPVIHLAHSVVWLGYGPLVMSISRPVASVARTAVSYATFPQARVAALLREQSGGWQAVARLVGEFALLASVIAADLLIPASEQRCAAVLLRLAGQRFASPRDAVEVTVPVTQEELAAAANLSRNSAGAILRGFAARGWVETGYGGIRLRAPARLRAILD